MATNITSNLTQILNNKSLDIQFNHNFLEVNNNLTEINQHFTDVNNHFLEVDNSLTEVNHHYNQFIQTTNNAAASTNKATSKFAQLGESLSKVSQLIGKGLTSAMMAIGTASWDAATQATESMNIIRTSTGATGEQLNGLMESYNKVGSQVPDKLGSVATVIADVSRKTGATGSVLEDMSKKIMDLSSLTKISSATISSSLTGTMQNWGIGAEQGSEMFDKMYFLSQKTGLGVNTLADKMTKFGGPMRQLGFDFDTSAALIGQWTKQGLDADMVLGSYTTALGNMSKVGVKDTQQALNIAMNKIKQAGTTAQANKLSIEAFGESSGPAMAAAIREGRLELGTMLQEMANSNGIIGTTAKDTETLGDKFGSLKNEIMIALAPLGKQLMSIVEKAFPAIEKIAALLKGGLQRALPHIEKFSSVVGSVLLDALNQVSNGIDFFIQNIDVLGPAVGVLALAFGVGLAASLWSVAVAGWAAIAPLLPFIAVGVILAAYITALAYMWKTNMFGIRDQTQIVFNYVQGLFDRFSAYISSIMPYIQQILSIVWPIIRAMWVNELTILWLIIQSSFTAIWDTIVWTLTNIYNFVNIMFTYTTGIFKAFLQFITGDFTGAWQTYRDTFIAVWEAIKTYFSEAMSGFINIGADLINGIITGIRNAFPNLWNSVISVGQGMKDAITGFLRISSPSKVMMEVGFWTTEGLADGLEDGEGRVLGSSQKVANAVKEPYTASLTESALPPFAAQGASLSPTYGPPTQASPTASSLAGPSSSALSFSPTINITMNGDSPTAAQDIAERVKQTIQEVFESASRRQGIVGV
ncbi:phage tail tape measure protein [Paenibacillus radicis (ex Xue et al. 2023)]|uniref:Phage tail tape measure protein n=1 Tax=Paenibacillus radicis (ex Xue et al. 2023) TaxID=2972489 RepID=A0ABT1YU15_9BACL|nr:phage tail tape measure protein [Paenibacillus radicis (ex Xue et al. 2023)]MCR8636185.1 phage tail tape measure protein [Paenibacillus radicis (ex Xue et al. 2023)]